MSRILGIDYGSKRVGIALSDDGKSFAFAKMIIENNDTLLPKIVEIAEKEEVESFVLGASDNPIGGDNVIMRRILIFGDALKMYTGLPVFYVSESYSSSEARRAITEKAKTRNKKSSTPVDAAAAAIILQKHLDVQRRTVSGQ